MKKLYIITLIVALLTSSLFVNVFAATNASSSSAVVLTATSSKSEVTVGETFQVSVYAGIAETADAYFDTGLTLDLHFDNSAYDVVIASKHEYYANSEDFIGEAAAPYDESIIAVENDYEVYLAGDGGITLNVAEPVLVLDVTAKKEGKFGMYFDNEYSCFLHGVDAWNPGAGNIATLANLAPVTVKTAGPAGPVVSEQPTTAAATSKEVVVNDVTYEDVYVAEGTAEVTGTITEDKKVYIQPLIFDDGKAHGNYAKVLVPGKFTGENPTIGFKIAIIGVPEGKIVTAGGTITIE